LHVKVIIMKSYLLLKDHILSKNLRDLLEYFTISGILQRQLLLTVRPREIFSLFTSLDQLYLRITLSFITFIVFHWC